MKNKGLLILSALVLLGALTMVQDVNVKEGTLDVLTNEPGVSLKELQVGGNETMSISKTFVQVGRRPSTSNYVLRFATAISGPIQTATYTRIADGLEENTKAVTSVYKGVSGNGVTYYYDGNDIVTEETEATKNYYWACYIVEYGTNEFVDTDFNVSLTIANNENETLTSEVKTTSLNSRLDNEQGIYKLTLENMTFKDGSTYKYLSEGDSLQGLFDVPSVSGYSFKSYCEVGKVSKFVSYNTMPAKDVTLAPAYDRTYLDTTISTEKFGKYNIGNYHPTWTATGLTSSKASQDYSTAFYNEKVGVYETLRTYKYSEAVNANSLFITMGSMPKDIVAGTRVTYTVQNQGEETLELKIAQTQSSGTPEADKYPSKTITLEPGEVKDVDLALIKHNTLMTVVKVLNDLTKPFNIALMLENAMSKVSLGKMKFADGTNEKYLYEASDLASYIPAEVGEYKYLGYVTKDAINTVKTNTIVGVDDLEIYPMYDVETYSCLISEEVGGKYLVDSIHSNSRVGFDANELTGNSSSRYTVTYNEKLGFYERSRLYKKTGGVNVGDSFIALRQGLDSPVVIGGSGYLIPVGNVTIVCTFENKGTEDIEFTVNQVDSSSNPQNNSNMMKHLQTVSLKPGEIKDYEMTLMKKDALLLYYKMSKATTSDFLLGAMYKRNV